ncbi:MAG: hypothetical protein E6767_07540 [Dysgonomonas sp.]|nr:hypothetical protein [Dysgonomonas sp.]
MRKSLCLLFVIIFIYGCNNESGDFLLEEQNEITGVDSKEQKSAIDDNFGGYGENYRAPSMSAYSNSHNGQGWTGIKFCTYYPLPSNFDKVQILYRESSFSPWRYYDGGQTCYGTSNPYNIQFSSSFVQNQYYEYVLTKVPEKMGHYKMRIVSNDFPGTPNAQGQYNSALATKWSLAYPTRIGDPTVSKCISSVNHPGPSSGQVPLNINILNSASSKHSSNHWEVMIKVGTTENIFNYESFYYTSPKTFTVYVSKDVTQDVTVCIRDIMVYTANPGQQAAKTQTIRTNSNNSYSMDFSFSNIDFRQLEWDF